MFPWLNRPFLLSLVSGGWLRVWWGVCFPLRIVVGFASGVWFALPCAWWVTPHLVIVLLSLLFGGWLRVWWVVCLSCLVGGFASGGRFAALLAPACPLLVMAKAMTNSGIGKRGSNDQLQPHHKSAITAVTKTTVIGSSG